MEQRAVRRVPGNARLDRAAVRTRSAASGRAQRHLKGPLKSLYVAVFGRHARRCCVTGKPRRSQVAFQPSRVSVGRA
jgi:hypothetical protein